MSLQFIVGGAGSGKSTYLYEWVTREAERLPRENFLVIVPEQFTLHTQQALVSCSPRGSILNIDVLSFNRLAYRIFDELGASYHQVLEETGKYMLLAHVAQRRSEDLSVLRHNIHRPGTISQIKSLFSEFMQYGISPEDVEEMAVEHKGPQNFYTKAADLALLYGDYIDALSDTYITAEEVLSRLIEIADDSAILSGATVVFDGFTGFTPVQYQFLQQLLSLTSRVVVTLNCDPEISLLEPVAEQELFAMSKTMAQRLTHMAEIAHTEVASPVLLTEHYRFTPDGMLSHLEANLFRAQSEPYVGGESTSSHGALAEKTSSSDLVSAGDETSCSNLASAKDEISLVSLRDMRQEITWIGCEILRQIRTEGMHYSDFAIACADLDSYAYLIPGIFDSLGIPYFLDTTSTVDFHPLTECIKAIFMVFDERFSYESVLRLLRTGLLGFRTEEIDHFENYILATNLHGIKAYRTSFSYIPKGYRQEDVVALDEMRERFATPILKFLDQFPRRCGSGRQITTALYEWIVSYDMEEQLRAESERLAEAGDEREARIYDRIYGLVMDLFDKIVMLLGEEEFTFRDYAKLLKTGMEALSVGVIPESTDQVMIGDLERSRLSDIAVLYVAGARDGAIPKTAGNGGLLSEQERRVLKEQGYELAPTEREKAFMQHFYLYFVMTQPSRKLCISYARLDTSGKSTIRSYIYGTLEQMFPGVKMQQIEELSLEQQLLSPSVAQAHMAAELRSYALDGKLSDTYVALLASGDWEQYLDAAFYVHHSNRVSKKIVDQIFGTEIRESVSKIETYHECAYAFFLQYGLKLEERLEYKFESVDMGSLYHDVLNIYARTLDEQENIDWQNITEAQMHEILYASISQAYSHIDQKQIMTSPREQFLFYQIENTLSKTVWALTEQVRHGAFVPRHFEVRLDEVGDAQSFQYQIDEMHKLRLGGIIDRIDTYETEDSVYVKIVDYKSGNQSLDLNKFYAGLQVQLVLYMNAAVEGMQSRTDKEVVPAAMFYSHVYRPLADINLKKTSGNIKELEQALLMEYRQKGYVISDMEKHDVIPDMDVDLDKKINADFSGMSAVIPVTTTLKGYDKRSSIFTIDEFALLGAHVKDMVQSTGEQIVAGEFDSKPFQYGTYNGCKYCPYHSICGFDKRLPGFYYNEVGKRKKEDVLQLILQEQESKQKKEEM